MNVIRQNEAANPLIGQQEQVGCKYPPTMLPKAPDKTSHHLDEHQKSEVHSAPQSGKRDHTGSQSQSREMALMQTRQHKWSQCDTSHVSCESMCLCVASSNTGTMGCNIDTPMAQQVEGLPIGCYDDYSSLESDNSMGEVEMTLNMSNKINSPSNGFDKLTDASDMMHEPSVCSEELLDEWNDMYCEPDEGSGGVLVVSQPMDDVMQSKCVQM